MRIVDLMAYTTICIWGVGAVILILLGLHAVQWLAWHVFKEFMGWRTASTKKLAQAHGYRWPESRYERDIMPDTTTLAPTDADIEELLISCGMCWAERSFWQLEDADLHPAIRAVLAKWGVPAYVRACAAPPAQEARVPLSSKECRDILEEVDHYNFAIDLIRAVEKHHGITAQKETPC